MATYPIYLELANRRVVVIGGGAVAVRKVCALLQTGARVVVVAEHIDDTLIIPAQQSNPELIKSKYSKDYIGQAVLVIAATNNHDLNKRIYKDCQQLEILCNVVDEPELCDFFVPAVVRRGDLQIAVSTEGSCPAYAGHVRKKLEQIFTEKHGLFLQELATVRKEIIEQVADLSVRKVLLGQLVDDKSFEYFIENGPSRWRDRAVGIIKEQISS